MPSGAGSMAALWREVLGLHLGPSRPGPSRGWLRSTQRSQSTNVLRLGFAFGPSQPPTRPRLVVRPLLTSPRRAMPSRAPPSRTTPRTKRTGHLGHPRRSPRVRPTTFIAHPPRLRNGPLMTLGFASWCRLARTAPPSTRSRPGTPAGHVFPGSRLRTPASLPTQPHDRAVAIGLWLVPSTSTGDSHPRAAGHVARTPCLRCSHTALREGGW